MRNNDLVDQGALMRILYGRGERADGWMAPRVLKTEVMKDLGVGRVISRFSKKI